MSQSDFGTINAATKSGSALATDLNSWRNALHSNHKGSAEPSYKATGMTWLDDSADPIWIYKVYDGTTWISLLEIDANANVAVPAGITSRLKFPLAGGSANALTLTPAVAMTAYADTDVVTFEAASNNSGAATLNISGVGAKAIRKMSGGADVALVTGDLIDGLRYFVNYDTAANSAAGAWILVNPTKLSVAIADGGTGASTASTAFDNLKQAATASDTGVVELATAAEVATGTDTARVPSVATMGAHKGVAVAAGCFNGTGTVALKRAFGVSGITDLGTGNYRVNFSSAQADTNYTVLLTLSDQPSNTQIVRLTSKATGSFELWTVNNGFAATDSNDINFAVFNWS